LSDNHSPSSFFDDLPTLPTNTLASPSETDTDIARNDSPKSQYEQRFVGFVDLLGFEQIVFKTSKEPYRPDQTDSDRNNLLSKIVAALSIDQTEYAAECFALLNEPYDPNVLLIKSKTFSDSIMFSAEHSEQGLCVLLHSILWVSRFMMREGFYCRGAITPGEIYWKDDDGHPIVFGPGLNKAIRLERSNAEIARVILCNASAKKLDEYRGNPKSKNLIQFLDQHVTQAKDGPWQVNFFADFISLDPNLANAKKEELQMLADKLAMVMIEYTESPRVYRKLRAIAEQINSVAKTVGVSTSLLHLP
jgi:hypothetical protein